MTIKTLEELRKEDEQAATLADKQVEETTRVILSLLKEIRTICQDNKKNRE